MNIQIQYDFSLTVVHQWITKFTLMQISVNYKNYISAKLSELWNSHRWGPVQYNQIKLKNEQEYIPLYRLTGWQCCLEVPLISHPCTFLPNPSQYPQKKTVSDWFVSTFPFCSFELPSQISKYICIWLKHRCYNVLFSFVNTELKFLRK